MRFLNEADGTSLPLTKTNNDSKLQTIQVIAGGLPRCATSSMQEAFEQHLGLGPCIHMATVLPNIRRIKLVLQATRERNKTKRQALLHELFDGHVSTADFPGTFFIEDLMEMYPDAHLILNLRPGGVEPWFKSVSSAIGIYSTWIYRAVCFWSPTDYVGGLALKEVPNVLRERSDGVIQNGMFDYKMYVWHAERVKSLAKQQGRPLLVFDPTMGWEPLCKFLGKNLPPSDVKFPHTNDMRFMQILKVILFTRGIVLWLAVLSPFIAAWWWRSSWQWILPGVQR